MPNGEQPTHIEHEQQVNYLDYLRAERQKVIEAQREAKAAVVRAQEAGKKFQAELSKLRGKKVIITGQLEGEEGMVQDGYEMFRSHRSVEDFDGVIEGIWARDSADEGYDRNKPVVFIRHEPADSKYRHHDVKVNLFDLKKFEIVDPPEVPETKPTIGSVATENTIAIS